MIDPLETVIAYLKTDNTLRGLTEDRIAAKSLYGERWKKGEASVVVQLYGGAPLLEPYLSRGGVAVTAYGDSAIEAMQVLQRVILLSQAVDRTRVTTEQGIALFYFFNQSASPTPSYDDLAETDAAIAIFDIFISQDAVT